MDEITIKDIAKECGVGVSTVSRAMNDHSDINKETKQMIMEVIEKTGYIPNNSARNLKRTDARCVAVLMKDLTNPLLSSALQIIETQVQKRKYALVIHHVDAYENELDAALQLVKEKRLRGIIFLGGTYQHDRQKAAKLSVPFVFCTIGAVQEKGKKIYSHIAVDDRAESRKMVDYLLDLGHKKIAIITEGSKAESVGKLRLEGYKDALRARGIQIDERLICEVKDPIDPCSMQNGYTMVQNLLASGTEFTAVFAIADFLAVGVCRALYEAGIKIPEDVSVAGFDGISIGEFYTPRLTTIRQPVEAMAEKTARLLFDIIEGRCGHEHIFFPAELVKRESAGKVRD